MFEALYSFKLAIKFLCNSHSGTLLTLTPFMKGTSSVKTFYDFIVDELTFSTRIIFRTIVRFFFYSKSCLTVTSIFDLKIKIIYLWQQT